MKKVFTLPIEVKHRYLFVMILCVGGLLILGLYIVSRSGYWMAGMAFVPIALGAFLMLDRYALDIGAVVTVTDAELHYMPGGWLLKYLTPKNSLYSRKILRLNDYAFTWSLEVYGEHGGPVQGDVAEELERHHPMLDFLILWGLPLYKISLLNATSRLHTTHITRFRVLRSTPGLQELMHITTDFTHY